jgi:FkbM family methyltransferase
MVIRMQKLISAIVNILPENLRNKFKCFVYNLNAHKGFHYSYANKNWAVTRNTIRLLFDDNPYYLMNEFDAYLRYRKIQKGDKVIDAGAHIGTFSLMAAKLVGPEGFVYAFEPDTINYQKLLRNIRSNGIANIKVFNMGLWKSADKLYFHSSGDLGSSIQADSSNGSVIIDVINLDNFWNSENNPAINFIKMDIEGAEIEALEGAANLLKHCNVSLSIASYHKVNGEETYKAITPILEGMGYTVDTIFDFEIITYAKK